MQIEVGTVNKLSRAAMIVGAAAFAYWTLAPSTLSKAIANPYPFNFAAGATGSLAVLATSGIERFRSLTRADPNQTFSMAYPNDRRKPRYVFKRAPKPAPGVPLAPPMPGADL